MHTNQADGLRARISAREWGPPARLEGTIAGRDESGVKINLWQFGRRESGGLSAILEAAPNHAIRSAYSAGKVNGQAFFVQFTDKKPLRVNSLADGSGGVVDEKRSRPPSSRPLGSYLDTRMRADVGVFLSDGKLRRFSGHRQKARTRKTGTYFVALKTLGHGGCGERPG